jgi:copper homeostasis protein (lipoprotein)
MPKIIIGLLIAVVIIIALVMISNRSQVLAAYEGILPAADCSGLKTELTLKEDGTFYLRETYLATRDGDKAFTSSGRWRKIKDGKRSIIQLNYDKPAKVYNFLVVDADRIKVLDRQLKEIKSPMNLTLTKKKSGSQ